MGHIYKDVFFYLLFISQSIKCFCFSFSTLIQFTLTVTLLKYKNATTFIKQCLKGLPFLNRSTTGKNHFKLKFSLLTFGLWRVTMARLDLNLSIQSFVGVYKFALIYLIKVIRYLYNQEICLNEIEIGITLSLLIELRGTRPKTVS